MRSAPFSVVDEPVHFDNLVKLQDGQYPHRGSPFSEQTIEEWSCGVGHEAAALPCPVTESALRALPSHEYTTGYIHYPTYFAGAVGLAAVLAPLGVSLLDAGRLFSALVLGLGILACGAAGWLVGLRRYGLIAATAVPAATSMTLLQGTIVNPTSTAILCGALIAGAGVRWLRTGRGFGWLTAATAFAASIAVVNTLPAAAVALAAIVVLVSPRLRTALAPVRVRWYHPLILAAVAIVPIVIWNRVIAATATVDNASIYGAFAPHGRLQVIDGLAREVSSLHSPWVEVDRLLAGAGDPMTLPRGLAAGLPTWITVIVFGGLLLALVVPRLAHERGIGSTMPPELQPLAGDAVHRLLAVCTLAVLILYPPALRLNNYLSAGIDHGIVDRYSISLAPLLVLLVLLLVRARPIAVALAVAGAYAIVVIPLAAL
jgi:hypothetical protein